MASTIDTLQQEIITSNAEAEKASRELELLRNRALEESAQESLIREQELREMQTELERCRIEKDDWEAAAHESKAKLDEARSALEGARRDLDLERQARLKDTRELEAERMKCDNLQSVLEDFQRGTFPAIGSSSMNTEYPLQRRTTKSTRHCDSQKLSCSILRSLWPNISIAPTRPRHVLRHVSILPSDNIVSDANRGDFLFTRSDRGTPEVREREGCVNRKAANGK